MTNRQKTVILNAIENSVICLVYADESGPEDCEDYIHSALNWLDDLAHFVENVSCEDSDQRVKIDTSFLPGVPDVIKPSSGSDDTLDGT